MRHHPRPHIALTRPMTAFAVTVLLTACGGGGDGSSNRALSSSPAPNAQSNNGTGSSLTTNINVTTGAFAGSGAIAEAINHGTRPGAPTPAPVPAPNNTGTTATSPSASGNDSAAQNPPASSGNDNQSPISPAPGTGAGTPPSTSNPGNDANGNGAAVAEPTKPAAPAVVPLVSDAGVRGEVVLAMMDQRACNQDPATMTLTTSALDTSDIGHGRGSHMPWLSATTWLSSQAYRHDMDKWKLDGRHMPIRAPSYVYECTYRDIRSYSNPVKSGNHTFSMETHPVYLYFNGPPLNHPGASEFGTVTKGINPLSAQYQIAISPDQFNIGGEAKVLQEEDFYYRTTETPDHSVPPGARRFETVLGSTTRNYGRQALIPFGALNQWQDGTGNHLQLLLIKADEPNTIRLCSHFDGTLVKRLHCVTWEVPANWTWGQELLGGRRYVIDDRSVYPNEGGFLYWRSNRSTGAQVERQPPQAD